MAPARDSPDEDVFDFNDLNQQPSKDDTRRNSQEEEIPKPKRIACVLCRKRKLKCDSKRPACSTCVRLQHDCSYDEVRKKSGPKRGYVKALEARLQQVETLLKTQDDASPVLSRTESDTLAHPDIIVGGADYVNIPREKDSKYVLADDFANMNTEDSFPWEMIGLGLDEPLPTQDVVDELNREYFDKVHPSCPMIHKARYYAAMNLPPHMRPPVALRYAMWALAAGVCDKYENLQEHFYTRARKYMHQDEMRGHGEGMITVAHAQAWTLIGTYEFKMMFFPRAWLSAGRASRMCMMMGLHRIDGAGLDVKQCLPPPKDHSDKEERRRTFWLAFCVDRYSSIGTGWPMVIEERDIGTCLPCEDEAFELNRPGGTMRLDEVLDLRTVGVASLTPFSGVVLLASLFGRNLTHLHRPGPNDRDDDLNGEFWKRHYQIDDILSATALGLPSQLRLPMGLANPNIVFLNMSIHTSTICLHQAAIFKADKNRMSSNISSASKVRCITAAAEIATIMRTVSHLDLSMMNPFISFCLYVASRVFVQYLKSRPHDMQVKSSLQFLLHAMHVIKRKNPLTESFLVQLDVDLEGAGLEDSATLRASIPKSETFERLQKGCPYSNLDGTDRKPPAYGDNGLGVYNNPDPNTIPNISHIQSASNQSPTGVDAAASVPFAHIINRDDSRRRNSPGSNPSNGYNRTPSTQDMDTSPDGNTPNSSLHQPSTRTSMTAASPNQDPQFLSERTASTLTQQSLLSSVPIDYNDFDLSSFVSAGHKPVQQPQHQPHQQQNSFALPSDWGSTGMTPGVSTGYTPGPDMIGMTDAEFTQMINDNPLLNSSFSTASWDTGTTMMDNTEALEALLASRR